jgi:eukaryotic-like serine/threonine-protein kinase
MTLAIGTCLGPYEILAPLGTGGMGEVYRARDTKLGRDVALKILPEPFATDPDRLARFQREAQVLASLNHPNIAAIYGLEESDAIRAIVMELVEGPTLADRLAHRGMPLDEAMPITRQIAEALEAAHERGVIHRDLKPANIKITPDGHVKVLDFGLAAIVQDPSRPDVNATHSPTLTLGATRAGVILGTAAYMSPEQAAGKQVDKRADIWSFGVVLWEMLTGKKLFDGETVSHTLADVLRAPIDFDQVPRSAPVAVRTLLQRCLDRDVKRRLRDIGEARVNIENYLTNPRSASEPSATASASSRLAIGAWIAAAVLLAALSALAVVHFRETPTTVLTTRFQVLPPDRATSADYPTISPDGRRLAFVATVDGKTLLWVRSLDSLTAQSLAGTEDAASPFWSPDSRFLAFFSAGSLKKVDVTGGPPQTLCTVDGVRGGTWSRDGTILFSGAPGPIRRVPAAGGVPTTVTKVQSPTELSHNWPQFLPDGRHFLYWLYARDADRERGVVIVGSLDDTPDSTQRRRLLASDFMAEYSAGRVLFEREGVLMAQAFDTEQLQLRGDPLPVVQEMGPPVTGRNGWRALSVSSEGTLAYQSISAKRQLAWFDRAGKEIGRLGQPEDQFAPRLSPDQQRVAVSRRTAQGKTDIWLLDLARGARMRFTTYQPANNANPTWSPDNGHIVFMSNRNGPFFDLYMKASSGAGGDELLLRSSATKLATDWSSDGRFILYQMQDPKTGHNDVWVLPMKDDRKPTPVLQTEFNELLAQFSPDGRWIAYQSDESGQTEIYVQAFPKSSGKFQVSTSGGSRARWRRDGKELFYLSPERRMMAVEAKATPTAFEAGRPRELFQTRVAIFPAVVPAYDVSADGQRFLIQTLPDDAESAAPITVVMNWAPKK